MKSKEHFFELRFVDKKQFTTSRLEFLERPPLRYFFPIYNEIRFGIESTNEVEETDIEKVEFTLTKIIPGYLYNHYIAFYKEVT